jgi:CDP-glucose 4,6-dehydratase
LEGVAVTSSTHNWASRRVLVTGATGFVGSWVVQALLKRQAQLVALIRDLDHQSELVRSGAIRHVAIVTGRLEDYATVERAVNEHEVDTVFHLGAQSLVGVALRNPVATFESNIRGTYHVLEACRVHADMVKAVIVASSDKAYGDSEHLPYTEEHPLAGRHPYDVSKSCADLLASTYNHTYGLPVVIARSGNIYGGGDLNWSRIVPGTVRSLLRGERPVLRSDGSPVRDYFYVEDAAAAYLTLAEQIDRPEVAGCAFNFSLESSVSALELVQTIQAVMSAGQLAPVVLATARGEITRQSLSARRARSVLGWSPKYDLKTGLAKTVEWYRAFLAGSIA